MYNADKTAYVTELENQSLMMRDISVVKTNTSFNLTHHKLSKILEEYNKYDGIINKP